MSDLVTAPGRAAGSFALRRKNWATGCICTMARWALHYHRIEVEGGENLPREGAALLLPKHRAYRDILIEAVVLRHCTGRYATYVMKMGLCGALGMLGGVKIVRPKDILRLKKHRERRERMQWARANNQLTLDYLAWLYERGEVVVSHPEGMRCQRAMGKLHKEIISHLLQVEAARGLRVALVPMGLEYESFGRPRARVHLRCGRPLYSDQFAGQQALMEALYERIAALSGFRERGPGRAPTP